MNATRDQQSILVVGAMHLYFRTRPFFFTLYSSSLQKKRRTTTVTGDFLAAGEESAAASTNDAGGGQRGVACGKGATGGDLRRKIAASYLCHPL